MSVDPDFDRGAPILDNDRTLFDPKAPRVVKRSLSNSAVRQSPTQALRSTVDKPSPTFSRDLPTEITITKPAFPPDVVPTKPAEPDATISMPPPEIIQAESSKSAASTAAQPSQATSSTAPTNSTNNTTLHTNGALINYPQPTSAMLIKEVQAAYYDITKLEVQCQSLIDRKPAENIGPQLQRAILSFHSRLSERYVDFIIFASHPAGGPSLHALTRKHKIPYRLWSRGIFKYLEFLRLSLPTSAEYMERYIIHCFSLLTLLVDPPYDTRHIWQEALGDVARFGMTMRASPISTVYWDELCKYWYLRAIQREPTVGRLYHHMSLLTTDIFKIYYFCKSMISVQQFDPDYGDAAKDSALRSALCRHTKFFYIHYSAMLYHMYLAHETEVRNESVILFDLVDKGIACLENHQPGTEASIPDELKESGLVIFGAMVAYCNITAILSVGRWNNQFFRAYYTKYGRSEFPLRASDGTDMDLFEQTAITLTAKMARFYMAIPKKQSLPHMITLIHFMLAIYEMPPLVKPFFERFDSTVLSMLPIYLNETLETVKGILDLSGLSLEPVDLHKAIVSWCKSTSEDAEGQVLLERINLETPGIEERNHYPTLKQRPLPEEHMILGSIWPHRPIDPSSYQECEYYTYDYSCPGEIGEPSMVGEREAKIIELALRLTYMPNGFLDFSKEYGCFRMRNKSN